MDSGPLLDLLVRVAETSQPCACRELILERLEGRRTLDCVVTPVEQPDGPVILVVELLDTTRSQRISRDDALFAQHDVSRRMVRQLAHEIKNPLGGLRGAAQLLERQVDDERLREYTSVIIGEADRLARLVDELLGPGETAKARVNVHELLEHVRRLVEAEASSAVELTTDYDPSLPVLELDRNQIIQAMLNLARNALQAVGSSGSLCLRSRALTNITIGPRLNRVVAAVEFIDDGPGVPESLRETIFYPLVSGRPGGVGLGLALAQDLVHRHEGLIEFDSRPGRTVFRILLTLSESNES